MPRLSLFLAAVVAALALTPATGEAAKLRYHACDGKKYWLVKDLENPAVKQLRIKMRKSRADGYAPRCLVAEAAAAEAQRGAADGKPPAEIDVYGARWIVGKYKCTYEKKAGYVQAQCRHNGKDANTVRFRLVG
ncbi:hypothetical protein [Solirubrobacter soli]|uniref:hypothetical protein n=1 Tax=Solirubrobacter soli TaxID=363832 RepID=UPI00040D17A5|nr:hypothetical protein [Solirubrobacter soli]